MSAYCTSRLLSRTLPYISVTGVRRTCENAQAKRRLTLASVSKFVPSIQSVSWSPEKINRVELIGNLGSDPVTRKFESQSILSTFSIAVSRPRPPDQERSSKSDWIDCEAWNEIAVIVEEHVKKGMQVHVVGSVQKDTWEDKNTQQPRSKIKVNVKEISLVAPPGTNNAREQSMGSFTKDDFYQNRSASQSRESTDKLWRTFFDNPNNWWDNRGSKTNDRQPDFKNKESGTALWMVSRSNPEWVIERLMEDGYLDQQQNIRQ